MTLRAEVCLTCKGQGRLIDEEEIHTCPQCDGMGSVILTDIGDEFIFKSGGVDNESAEDD